MVRPPAQAVHHGLSSHTRILLEPLARVLRRHAVEGSYLLRASGADGGPTAFALSFLSQGKVVHRKVEQEAGGSFAYA